MSASGASGRYTHGMDVAAVRDIANRLAKAQSDLAAAASASDSAVRVLRQHWVGDDSGIFYGRWPALREQLDGQSQELQRLVSRLREQAGDQEETSGAGSGGSGGPGTQGGVGPGSTGPGAAGANAAPPDDDHYLDGSVKLEPEPSRDGEDVSPRHRDNTDSTRTDTRYDNDRLGGWERGQLTEWNTGTPQEDPKGPVAVDPRLGLVGGETELWQGQLGPGHTFGDRDSGNYAQVGLHSEGRAEGEVYVGKDGLGAEGSVIAGGYIASTAGAFTAGSLSGAGRGYLGAEAGAKGGVSLGTGGLNASAGGEVFLGGKLEGSLAQDLGPVDVGVGAEISYGIGAHAEADLDVSADNVGVSLDIGATLGIGGGVELDVDFDPTFWN
jgi:uncharacterized protein YukE